MGNQEKSELRRHLHRARTQLAGDEWVVAEREIGRLFRRRIKRGCRTDVYWPMGSELRLDGFARAAQERGAKLCLSYIEPRLWWMWFTSYPANGVRQERERGRAKLHVPQFAGHKIRVHDLPILLVPIVGTDHESYRSGQAGGYYDATSSAVKYHLQAKTMGVGFACQLIDRLPHEAHNIPLDGFASEQGTLAFRRFRRSVHRRTS